MYVVGRTRSNYYNICSASFPPMYTFINHEGSTVYIQSKIDRKLLLQTDKTHTHKKDNSPTISTDSRL